MCSLSLSPENINAMIAASAALAGVFVSLLGNWLLSYISREHERKVVLRSKYEQLAFFLVDSVGDYHNILTAESNIQLLKDSQPVSAQKVSSLAQLYFPELVAVADGYLLTLVAFRNACSKAAAENQQIHQIEAISSSQEVAQAQSVLDKAKNSLELWAYTKTYTLS